MDGIISNNKNKILNYDFHTFLVLVVCVCRPGTHIHTTTANTLGWILDYGTFNFVYVRQSLHHANAGGWYGYVFWGLLPKNFNQCFFRSPLPGGPRAQHGSDGEH